MAALCRIEFRDVPDLDALLSESGPVRTSVIGAATAPPSPSGSMLFPASESIDASFEESYQQGDVMAAALSNVSVARASVVRSGNDTLVLGMPFLPGYVAQYIEEGWLRAASEDIEGKAAITIDKVCVLVGHFNAGVYGHWLLECLPKLLLLKRLRPAMGTFAIVMPEKSPSFMRKWIELLLPGQEIVTFDDSVEYALCRKLIIPGVCYARDYFFHPVVNTWLDDLVASIAGTFPRLPARLYITRKLPSIFRKLEDQHQIEKLARSRGLTLVSPETLPIAAQVSMFSGAEILVGEYGSSLHNAIFSPAGTRLLALNHINGCQTRVAQLRGHGIGYILPPDGPLLFERTLGAVRRGYRIDPGEFAARLDEVLSAAG